MTDMRATERILEWIGEQAAEVKADRPVLGPRMDLIVTAIDELRRRGDTLVRADDLTLVLPKAKAWSDRISDPESVPRFNRAFDRLETALGGKMR